MIAVSIWTGSSHRLHLTRVATRHQPKNSCLLDETVCVAWQHQLMETLSAWSVAAFRDANDSLMTNTSVFIGVGFCKKQHSEGQRYALQEPTARCSYYFSLSLNCRKRMEDCTIKVLLLSVNTTYSPLERASWGQLAAFQLEGFHERFFSSGWTLCLLPKRQRTSRSLLNVVFSFYCG